MSTISDDGAKAYQEAELDVARLISAMAKGLQLAVKEDVSSYQTREGVLALARLVAATKGIMPTEPPVRVQK